VVKRIRITVVSLAVCAAATATTATNIGVAHASTASIAITGGGLTMSNPSVTVVSRNRTELDLSTSVTDARGTGSGWFLSLSAASSSAPASANLRAPASPTLIVTGAHGACQSGAACTLPVNTLTYPLSASLSGTRTLVFEAAPSSGLGAESVDLRVVATNAVPSTLKFDLSLSTPPSTGSPTGSTSPSCSIPDLVASGTCPAVP
jgi:hypothetical protein